MKKSLARLDLNLLFTLQLLLQELSVSRAAKKLNVTPSTVSKSLGKLRDWFDDPLFVKTPTGLAPTPLTLSMEQDLNDWLQISAQIAERRTQESTKGIQFHLAIESPLLLTLLGELLQQIHERYPQAKVKTSNWDYDSLEAIIRGDADIGFTGRESHPRSKESLDLLPYFVDYEVLFTDLPKVYLRDDHPALKQEWNLDTFLRYTHINILWEKSETWALDNVLAEQGLSRTSTLTMASFEQSLFMAAQAGHEYITTAPNYCEHYVKQLHSNLISLPIPVEEEFKQKLMIPFTLIWHKRNAYNPKINWLRENIKQLSMRNHT
ncbi:HTH-type transcriptional regulator YidZ [Vibrio coralliilyticus]|uniref:HTH-type transcriptional regulator YidZ n=1 Tax=Vibrio coralliilyticus TaxID=190893 RepID=UPI000810A833|nr:HTH-type transcriptional regulator YidZ [Vibrio coralliilyticus]ANW23244.1 DNA-binding transcriptional regulator [Vibrio coralliilyticus]NOI28102.1 HTH-type transcriptional regulator YidZ [Vibrio coralliilyticus]NOI49437.1 HTH-type transcriptional regulator YidZ [Vibrio coralliilyticus]NUW67063.1 HTH-type transcriptional regulator YidZ [Vibrio coralliilyticus]PAU37821.1 HTH-type transcriptional regulator YidZ [Vibrio coralliilyticus]